MAKLSNRTKAIITGIIILILIILVLLFLPRPGTQPAPEPTPTPEAPEEITDTPNIPIEEPAPEPLTAEETEALSAETVATIFVERFGSYSSESNLQNIEDVLPLTSQVYRQELEQFITETRQGASPEEYYGVNTYIVSSVTTDMDTETGTATLSVNTQREETFGDLDNTSIRYQEIQVELVTEGTEWKVNNATWL